MVNVPTESIQRPLSLQIGDQIGIISTARKISEEELEFAKKRGARIYAELIGYGMSGDAYHITSPSEDGDGGYRAMQEALKMAKVSSDDIDYINAHGTSTKKGDEIELNAIISLMNRQSNAVIAKPKIESLRKTTAAATTLPCPCSSRAP